MTQKTGLVVKTNEEGWAEVITDKLDACAECTSSRSCHSDCKSTRVRTRVYNSAGAHEGDTVVIYISPSSVLKSAAILYLVPVFFMLSGALTGSSVAARLGMEESGSALLFGLIGLAIGFLIVRTYSTRLKADSGLVPKIAQVIDRGDDHPLPLSTPCDNCGAEH
jgi:sigma-E factor negative regulatory protein RseC